MITCDRCGAPVMDHEEDSSSVDLQIASWRPSSYWTKRFNLCPACTDIFLKDYLNGKAIPALDKEGGNAE